MTRLPKLKHVKFVRTKGRLYAYFNTGEKVAGRVVYAKLPPPSSVGFMDSYAVMLGHRTRKISEVSTVARVADDFESSRDFRHLAMGTQKFYSSTLRRIREQLGRFPINAVEPRHVREVVENRIATNASRNAFLAVLGAFYTYARRNDLTNKEPTKDIKPYPVGSHDPWPEELLEAGLIAEHDRTRLAIHLLYFTGQRIGDVCNIRWSQIRDGVLYLAQQKTGKHLSITIHSALARELERAERRGDHVISSYTGQRMTDQVIRRELKAFGDSMGFTVVPHGLRKNAVNALLEAGATVPETAAITGQSYNVVEQYAKKVNQVALSKAAIEKLENATGRPKPGGKPVDDSA